MSRWYVVQSRPRQEEVAKAHLERQGYRIFAPRIARGVRQARQIQRVLRPLFPRYFFIELDLQVDRWRPVQGTYGVSTLIMDGDRPRVVPRGLVEELRARTDGTGEVILGGRFEPGDRVRLIAGPLAGQTGNLADLGDSERVAVLFEMLGAERLVIVDANDLVAARA